MKSAVAHLEPHMEKSDQGGRGRVVLATVKGDVHDIGKNLVDIILTNNGYEVFNLGIKVGVNEMLSALEEHQADALGMSGLLVKSTLIMRENLELMNERGMSHVPGPARRRRAHAHLRRARPPPGLRRPPLLRQGRLRGAAGAGPTRASSPRRRGRPDVRSRDLRAQGLSTHPRRRRRGARGPSRAAAPTSTTTTPSSRRPSSASASPRACPSTRSASTST